MIFVRFKMNDVVEKDNESLIKGIVAVGAVVVVIILGIGIYSGQKEDARLELANSLYKFTEGEFKEFKDGKRPASSIVKKFKSIVEDSMDGSSAVVPGIEIADELYEKSSYQESAEVLKVLTEATSDQLALNFVYTRYATSLEQTGKNKEAIDALPKSSSAKKTFIQRESLF